VRSTGARASDRLRAGHGTFRIGSVRAADKAARDPGGLR